MWKSQPGKWVLWAPVGVGLTFLASTLITTPALLQQLQDDTQKSLSTNGFDWAKLEWDGRDARLFGDAPDQAALDSVQYAVMQTEGVRTLEMRARVAAAAVAPAPAAPQPAPAANSAPVAQVPPSLSGLQVNGALLTASGTWDEAHAKSLIVHVGNSVYTFPGSPELTSVAGQWSLKLAQPLPEGSYAVWVESSDGVSPPVAGQNRQAAVVAAAPAAMAEPTVAVVAPGTAWPHDVSGTWPEAPGRKLAITLAGNTWELGTAPALKSDGKGNWTLKPDVTPAPGAYDLTVQVTDANGAVKSKSYPAAVQIEAPKPPAPTVEAPAIVPPGTLSALPGSIAGTWPEAPDRNLKVTLAGNDYVLRKDAALTSDGQGHWTLKLDQPLVDGVQKLVVQTLDGAGANLGPAAESTVEVNLAPPAAPTVATVDSDKPVTELHGTWAEGDANQLTVSVANTPLTATLGGADGALKSDGKGNWVYTLPQPLETGAYDIVVRSSDAAGHTSSDLGTAEVSVKPKPAEQAEVTPEPVQPATTAPAQTTSSGPDAAACDSALTKLRDESPLRFDFNHDGLPQALQPAVKAYADVMNGAQCSGLSFNVQGNADRWGSEEYNRILSQSRADVIVRELSKQGIPADKMAAKGLSETQPLDPKDNLDAWKRNRRVEVTVAK